MSRYNSQRKMGFFATPPHLVPLIAEYLTVEEPEQTLLLDPCAGEGEAIKLLGGALGVTRLYANELDELRADTCRAVEGLMVTCGDAIRELKTNEDHFSLLYLNPPYDDEGEREGRTEWKFLSTLRFLQINGIVVFIVPLDVLRRKEFREKLPLRVKDIMVCRFPGEDFNAYGQAVLFARRRPGRVQEEIQNYQRQVDNPATLGDGQMPVGGKYIVPGVKKLQSTYFRSQNCDTYTLRLLSRTPIVQKALNHGLSKARGENRPPLAPYLPGHRAMMMATGAFNGVYRMPDGSLFVLTGLTAKQTITSEEEDDGRKVSRIRTTPASMVRGMALEKTLQQNELVIYEYM